MFATKPHGYRRRGQANMYVIGRRVNTSPDKNAIEITESPAENRTPFVVKSKYFVSRHKWTVVIYVGWQCSLVVWQKNHAAAGESKRIRQQNYYRESQAIWTTERREARADCPAERWAPQNETYRLLITIDSCEVNVGQNKIRPRGVALIYSGHGNPWLVET